MKIDRYYRVTHPIKCVNESGSEVELRPGGYLVRVDGDNIIAWDGVHRPLSPIGNRLRYVTDLSDIDVVFAHKTGSHAYGTAGEKSDTDIRVVYTRFPSFYMDPFHTDELDEFRMKTSADVEYTFYDMRKFVRLAALQNPNILESFWSPADCELSKIDISGHVKFACGLAWDVLSSHRDAFLTKNCSATFVNYAKQQIVKARGQDKFQNMEKERVQRKTPIDFCRVWTESGSMALTEWLDLRGYLQERCGLAKCDGMRDGYSLYYSHDAELSIGFNGVCRENANDVALSSIPKGLEPVAFMQFNKDAYSIHCSKYRDYQHWLNTRNEDRWVTVQSHGQKIDGKNMLHCVRLLMTAMDIAKGKGVVVRRSEDEIRHLLEIKNGEVDLQSILLEAERMYDDVIAAFESSDLPNAVDEREISGIYRGAVSAHDELPF